MNVLPGVLSKEASVTTENGLFGNYELKDFKVPSKYDSICLLREDGYDFTYLI
jgi:hypothetical protein